MGFVAYLEKIGYPDAKTEIDHNMYKNGGIRGGKTYAECRAKGRTADQCQPKGNGCDGKNGMCIQDPEEACEAGFVGESDFVTQKARESCKFAFDNDLHWNRHVTYKDVDCPASLTALTGLRPISSSSVDSSTIVPSQT